jgi:hypothetical protein
VTEAVPTHLACDCWTPRRLPFSRLLLRPTCILSLRHLCVSGILTDLSATSHSGTYCGGLSVAAPSCPNVRAAVPRDDTAEVFLHCSQADEVSLNTASKAPTSPLPLGQLFALKSGTRELRTAGERLKMGSFVAFLDKAWGSFEKDER